MNALAVDARNAVYIEMTETRHLPPFAREIRRKTEMTIKIKEWWVAGRGWAIVFVVFNAMLRRNVPFSLF